MGLGPGLVITKSTLDMYLYSKNDGWDFDIEWVEKFTYITQSTLILLKVSKRRSHHVFSHYTISFHKVSSSTRCTTVRYCIGLIVIEMC